MIYIVIPVECPHSKPQVVEVTGNGNEQKLKVRRDSEERHSETFSLAYTLHRICTSEALNESEKFSLETT